MSLSSSLTGGPPSHRFLHDGRPLLQPGVAVDLVIRWRIGRQAETLTGPGAQIDIFAALTAKRPEPVFGRIDAGAAAGGADHCFGWWGLVWIHRRKLKLEIWVRTGVQRPVSGTKRQ